MNILYNKSIAWMAMLVVLWYLVKMLSLVDGWWDPPNAEGEDPLCLLGLFTTSISICLEFSFRLNIPKTPRTSASYPDQMPEPPRLAPFNVEKQRFYSEPLPVVWAPHPISKAKPGHLVTETRQPLVFAISFFGDHPLLVTKGEG